MPTKIPANLDQIGKTTCGQCGSKIGAGDYRVAVTAVEMPAPDSKQSTSRRSNEPALTAFCAACVAKLSTFSLPNPWKPSIHQSHTTTLNEPDPESNPASSPAIPPPESSGEASQRAHILKFLNDPRSMAMRSDMRDVARMWAEGASLNEVARKLGKDQSTISRIIQGARKMSYALG